LFPKEQQQQQQQQQQEQQQQKILTDDFRFSPCIITVNHFY